MGTAPTEGRHCANEIQPPEEITRAAGLLFFFRLTRRTVGAGPALCLRTGRSWLRREEKQLIRTRAGVFLFFLRRDSYAPALAAPAALRDADLSRPAPAADPAERAAPAGAEAGHAAGARRRGGRRRLRLCCARRHGQNLSASMLCSTEHAPSAREARSRRPVTRRAFFAQARRCSRSPLR